MAATFQAGAMNTTVGEKSCAITGIGQSEVSRVGGKSALELTVTASLQAIESAGLSCDEIDGIATWPGLNLAATPGMAPVGVFQLKEALGLELDWFSGGGESAGQFGAIVNACAAVACGLANHVLCFRTLTEYSAQTGARKASVMGVEGQRVQGLAQWQLPFQAYSAANWTAQYAQRYFHEFNATREQLGWLAVNQRRNASLNSGAVKREVIDIDDYLKARMISSPLCLLDCDIPVDASTVVIVSRKEQASQLDKPAIQIEALGCAMRNRMTWDQHEDLTTQPALQGASRMMWSRTNYKPADVDIAELYDGFSITTLNWLEALGFCGRGEAASFIEGGLRIALEGELPLNTHGGQLSAGRTHGFGLLHEACTQLWGEAGRRQVTKQPELAVVAAGGGIFGACLLLSRQ